MYIYLIIQLVVPRAKWKAFTLCQPFLDISQGKQDRFFNYYYLFLFTVLWRLEHCQCRIHKIWIII